MLRLTQTDNHYYRLKDTETQKFLSRCQILPQLYNGKEALVLWSVCTYEQFQGKGFATTMLQRVIKKFSSQGKPILLHVYKSNEIAMHLYEKLGFKIIDENYIAPNSWVMQYKP